MSLLLKKARIIDPGRPLHQTTRDILVQNGHIAEIADQISDPVDRVVDVAGLHVSPGFVETFADAGDPGTEYRETLATAASAAAAGGFTHLFVLPNTLPVRHDRTTVEATLNRRIEAPVRIHAIGAVTRDNQGKELAEMHDMRAAGAIAFSDGLSPIRQAGILVKAFQFVKAFDGVLMQMADDGSLVPHGLMHEGVMSTRLGLPGRPAIGEELSVSRDIRLCQYAGSRLHLTGITLPSSIAEVQEGKRLGIDVTCAVTPHHLLFCDEDLEDYDTHLKTHPPLRTRSDRESLLQAVRNGEVDIVSSHHLPQHIDHKQCEFEYARPGMIGLETCFGILRLLDIDTDTILQLLSRNPRRVFGLPDDGILPSSPADMTLFLPDEPFLFTKESIRSRSSNTPLLGKTLKGRILGTVLGQTTLLSA
jgi:dihydroorotase